MVTLAAPPVPQWVIAPADEAAIAELAAQLDCPLTVAHLLIARGIPDRAAAILFFHPSLDHLHDPLQMLGMVSAVNRIQQAVTRGEPILIYGDYDVDGTTATVLLKTAIERIAAPALPAKVTWHVPHRIREGYGMQNAVLGRAAEDGIRLVISVDTGIRAFAAAAEAKALGLDLIVTDHHLPDGVNGIPEAVAVINPAQPGCPYPFKSLCGAAVAFKLAHALLAAAAITPEQQARLRQVLLPSFLKIVAIATIADSVPLVGENRTLATLGLRELRNPVQPGLRALMEVAKLPFGSSARSPTAMEVGFRLAPRINAAGRMDVADDVIELLLTRDAARAQVLAEKLDHLNQDRRDTEATALHAIETQLEALRHPEHGFPADCVILDNPAWHRGVLGILASRIVDRTGRPALILTHEDGLAHGSGRSIAGFHLLDALTAVHAGSPELFTRFGGHAHAVGFSLPSAHLSLLRSRMSSYTAGTLTLSLLCPELQADAEITLAEITPSLWQWLARCGPFGNGNPEPVFLARAVTLAAPVRILKEKHIALELTQDGSPARLRALGWSRVLDWPAHCSALDLKPGIKLDIAFRLAEDRRETFQSLQLELLALRCT